MSDSSDSQAIPDADFRRHWRIVTAAGVLGSIYYMTCVFGGPFTKFMVELGASPFHFGLIAGLGAFSLTTEMVSGMWANRLRRRKALWMALTIAHRLIMIGVLAAPALFADASTRIWWIVAVLFVHHALTHLGIPMWMSWMSDLVPTESLNRHMATRQRVMTAWNIGAQVLVALGFHYFESHDQVIRGFIVLGSGGVILGVIDICLFGLVPEPPHEPARDMPATTALLEPLRNAEFRPFLVFRAYWHFSIMVAAPFFFPYLIGQIGLSVLTVQCLLVSMSLGVAVSSRLWGMLCDTYGQRPILQLVVAAKPLTPLIYLCVPPVPSIAIPVFAMLFFIDGAVNSGAQLAMQGVVLRRTPRRNRTMYIASANFFALGVAGGVAPLISGVAIEPLTDAFSLDVGVWRFSGYHAVFLVSVVLRSFAFPLVSRLREPDSLPLGTMLAHLRVANPLAVTNAAHTMSEAPDEGLRARAAERLGQLESPLAIHELIRALRDPQRVVRRAAADSLGHIGMMEACEPLAHALFDDDGGVGSSAARALGRIGGYDSLKALLRNLNRLDREALDETIESLGHIGDGAAILPLICLFHDVENRELRRHIATALGRLTQTESVDDVIASLHSGAALGVDPTVVV